MTTKKVSKNQVVFGTSEKGTLNRTKEGYLLDDEGNIIYNDDGTPRKNMPGPGRPKNSKSLYQKAPTVFTPALKKKVVNNIAKGINAEAACAAADISRHTYYKHLRKDPKFAEAVSLAKDKYLAKIEEQFTDRIEKGSRTVVYDGFGNVITETYKQNDNLLVKSLEAEAPQKYGKKTQSTNVNVNVDPTGNSAVSKLAQQLGIDVDKVKKQSEEIDVTDYEER